MVGLRKSMARAYYRCIRELQRKSEAEQRVLMNGLADEFESKVGRVVRGVSSAATQLQYIAQDMSEIVDETSREADAVAAMATAYKWLRRPPKSLQIRSRRSANKCHALGHGEKCCVAITRLTRDGHRIGDRRVIDRWIRQFDNGHRRADQSSGAECDD